MLAQLYVALPLISVGFAMLYLASSWSRPSFVHVGSSKVVQQAFSRSPALKTKYRALRFLESGHTETIFAAFLRKPKAVEYMRSTLTDPDGGTTAVDMVAGKVLELEQSARACVASADLSAYSGNPSQELPPETPIVILLPGMSSSSRDTYVQHLAHASAAGGFRTVVLNGRGCGSRVTTPQTFSASFTGDIRYLNTGSAAVSWYKSSKVLSKPVAQINA